ncbi:MAG: phosphoribosyl transferase protein [Verrucomicrobiales bacterium]|nr:phosphoribosyl transferase protein [Verrucomicrobiales bacterium]
MEAGQILSAELQHYSDWPEVIVLALPRGGVAVGVEVAKELHAPLDIFVVRKLGVPGQQELAMGAIASGGIRILNPNVVRSFEISEETINAVASREQRELERRERFYRDGRHPLEVRGRIVLIVDDGLATGATMKAAVAAIRKKHPARIIVAVPVAAPETCAELDQEVDELVCARTPDPFMAVGIWYRHFPQLTDEEVRDLLQSSAEEYASFHAHAGRHGDII